MLHVLEKTKPRIKAWVLRHAGTPTATWALGFFSFLEASVFPIPPSTFMVALIAAGQKHRWIYYATVSTITSVLGGLFGYLVGLVFFDTLGQWLIARYDLAEEVARIGVQFADNAFWAIFLAAFTPIPYKAFTISAGFFSINVFIFTLASVIGRGLRFFIIAYLAYLFGERVARVTFRYFTLATIILAVAAIIFFFWQVI